jgi:hypothetical protein
MTLLNCTGYDNKTANFRITRALNTDQTLTVKNCISYQGAVELGSFAIQEANSWLAPFFVTAEDFRSLDASPAASPRLPDGRLPWIDFLQLAPGSDLIDAGVDLCLPFNGSAPDLGAFESDYPSAVTTSTTEQPRCGRLDQNYPNPFNPQTAISYELPASGLVRLEVFDMLGRETFVLVNAVQEAGFHTVILNMENRRTGMYLYRVTCGSFTDMKKILLVK